MAAGSPTKGDISGEPLPTGLWYGDPGPCTTNHNQRSTTIGTADTPVQEMVASLSKEGYGKEKDNKRRFACRCGQETRQHQVLDQQTPYRTERSMMCSRVYWCCDGQSSKEDEITQVAAVTIVSLPLLQFPNIPDTRSVAGKTKPQATIEMALSY
jgi:hypothetical protein